MSESYGKDHVLSGFGPIKYFRYCSTVHYRDPVTHPEQLRHLRRDHQDRDALFGKLHHQFVDLSFRSDVDPLRGLVKDQTEAE